MNKIALFLVVLCTSSLASSAQIVSMDSSFAGIGFVQTKLRLPYNIQYSSPLDVSPTGDVYIAGIALTDSFRRRVNLYNSSGDSVTTFGAPSEFDNSAGASVVKVQDDGKVIYNESDQFLTRLHPDGQLDTTFGTDGKAPLEGLLPFKLTIAPDGRIVVAGMSWGEAAKVAVFDTDGKPDSSFANNGVFDLTTGDLDFFFDFDFQADGKIVLCGFTYYSGGAGRPMLLCRLTSDGVLDPSFGDGGYLHHKFSNAGGEFYAIALRPDEKIIVTGYDFSPYRGFLARFNPNGVIDSTFGQHGVSFLTTIAEGVDVLIRPDGRILVYGYYDRVANIEKAFLLQFLENGTPDMNFGVQGVFSSPHGKIQPPMAMVPYEDNMVVICGIKAFTLIPNSAPTDYFTLQRIILDLSLGTLPPPTEPALEQVLIYPNPVGSNLNLKFNLDAAQTLQFDLQDAQGKHLETLLSQQWFAPGEHQQSLQLGGNLPPGHYVLSISVGGARTMALRLVKG